MKPYSSDPVEVEALENPKEGMRRGLAYRRAARAMEARRRAILHAAGYPKNSLSFFEKKLDYTETRREHVPGTEITARPNFPRLGE